MPDSYHTAPLFAAAVFAAERHAAQRRKGAREEPYINHLLEVAQLVAQVTSDPEILAAALLHDTVEDTATTEAELVGTFGRDVALLVMECTDDKRLPEAERKRLQVVHAPDRSPGATLVKLADKISNLRSLHRSPPVGWSAERRQHYCTWAEEVVRALPHPHPLLMAEFRLAVEDVRSEAE